MSLILDYLGKNSIVYIKPANILLNDHYYIKLIDFGISKIIKDFTYIVIGTPAFMAPQVIDGNEDSFHADYWSFGICMNIIYYGQYPFNNENKDIMEIYLILFIMILIFLKLIIIIKIQIFLFICFLLKKLERLCTFQKFKIVAFIKILIGIC